MGNVRPTVHIRPAKHLSVACELHLKFKQSYIDHENTLNMKKVTALSRKQPLNYFTWAYTGPQIPCGPDVAVPTPDLEDTYKCR